MGGWRATVWVRAQGADGRWEDAQLVSTTLLPAPGGLGLAWRADGALVVAYGDGMGAVWLRVREGQSWSEAERLGTGELRALEADPTGALHVLLLSGRQPGVGLPRYGVRAIGGRWAWSELPGGTSTDGQLALLVWPDDPAPVPHSFVVRRFVLLRSGGAADSVLRLFHSEDGRDWTATVLPPAERPGAAHLLAALGPDGTGVVGLVWSQRTGGLFTAVSVDSGLSFGEAEVVVADRTAPAALPHLAYDAARFRLAVSWVEQGSTARTRLAVRDLVEDAAPWQRARLATDTPVRAPARRSAWERPGQLWGSAAGDRHWLLGSDTRDLQVLDLASLTLEEAR
jgi:hypothetical protein